MLHEVLDWTSERNALPTGKWNNWSDKIMVSNRTRYFPKNTTLISKSLSPKIQGSFWINLAVLNWDAGLNTNQSPMLWYFPLFNQSVGFTCFWTAPSHQGKLFRGVCLIFYIIVMILYYYILRFRDLVHFLRFSTLRCFTTSFDFIQ